MLVRKKKRIRSKIDINIKDYSTSSTIQWKILESIIFIPSFLSLLLYCFAHFPCDFLFVTSIIFYILTILSVMPYYSLRLFNHPLFSTLIPMNYFRSFHVKVLRNREYTGVKIKYWALTGIYANMTS